ncbi:MAG: glycosyltransferase family 39 protein [Patescibacteria group bacterium]|jgi:4-amino-4-deoxy-L-arabinose transferase-like glycosyltransferase
MPDSKKLLFSFLAIAALALFVFFWNLGKYPLEKWDEAIHAEVTHEMLKSGNWLELTWDDQPYYRKPPLRFWLQGMASGIFGENEFTIRFWSATAGVLTTLLIAWWAWQAFKKIPIVWLSAGIFLTGRFIFYHAFRTGETDGLLVFLLLLSLWLYWQSWTKPKLLYWTSSALTLAVLTKFSAAVFAGLAIFLHLLFTKKFKNYSKKQWLIALGIGIGIFGAWFISQIILRGGNFINEYISEDIWTRATTNLYINDSGVTTYLGNFMSRFFPWACFSLPAIIWISWKTWKEKNQLYFLWLIFLVETAVILSLNASKTNWYLLPLYPFLALIIGAWIYNLKKFPIKLFDFILLGGGLLIFLRQLPLILNKIDKQGSIKDLIVNSYLFKNNAQLSRLLLAFIFALIFIIFYWLVRKYQLKKLWLSLLSLVFVGILGAAIIGQIYGFKEKTGDPVLPQMRDYLQKNPTPKLFLYRIYVGHEPTIRYYLGNLENTKFEYLKSPNLLQPGEVALEIKKDKKNQVIGQTILESLDYHLVKIP